MNTLVHFHIGIVRKRDLPPMREKWFRLPSELQIEMLEQTMRMTMAAGIVIEAL